MSEALPRPSRLMRGSGGLGHTPWVATGIVRCRFDPRRWERLGCVGEQLGRIVGTGSFGSIARSGSGNGSSMRWVNERRPHRWALRGPAGRSASIG
jgi:hypothetical protein